MKDVWVVLFLFSFKVYINKKKKEVKFDSAKKNNALWERKARKRKKQNIRKKS